VQPKEETYTFSEADQKLTMSSSCFAEPCVPIYLTNSAEQLLVTQPVKKFPDILETKGSTLRSKVPATGPILSQMNPAYTFTSYFFEIHCNYILVVLGGLAVSVLATGPKVHGF
jgi:hypothetical protein